MELCAVGQLTVNYKVISIFKKDFWKDFIDEENGVNNILDETKNKKNISTKKETIVNDKKYTCECGSHLNKNGKTKHEQSLKHKKFIDSK